MKLKLEEEEMQLELINDNKKERRSVESES